MTPPPIPSSEYSELDHSKPLVLLLGNIDHEGITSWLKASGEQYKKKVLDSTPKNWQSILEYFDIFKIRAVMVKLNAQAYTLLAHPNYQEVGQKLLARIANARHMVSVFEDFLSGYPNSEETKVPNESHWQDNPPQQVLDRVNSALRSLDLNLVPYSRNADLTVVATRFLTDALEQLLFRVYVPRGRLWSNEVDRLLQLFRDYLLKTGRTGVRLDQKRTDLGVAYEFHGEERAGSPTLADDFQDFSRFLDLCVSNPQEAERLLENKNVDAKEIAEILTRYAKEAKRLQTDLKHDRERKLLSIRQLLESELVDVLPSDYDWKTIEGLASSAIPSADAIQSAYMLDYDSSGTRPASIRSPTVINLSPQIINTVNGVVAREIYGGVNLSAQDRELLKLIQKWGNEKAPELVSAVHELSDHGIPKSDRLSRAQKLKSFLYSVGSRAGSVATNVLQSYIEHKLSLK
jgi:hypothetical protein